MTALREVLIAAIAAQMDGDRKRLAQELVDKHGTALLAALDDAERYRWLRDPANNDNAAWLKIANYYCTAEEIDAAIDAAREGK